MNFAFMHSFYHLVYAFYIPAMLFSCCYTTKCAYAFVEAHLCIYTVYLFSSSVHLCKNTVPNHCNIVSSVDIWNRVSLKKPQLKGQCSKYSTKSTLRNIRRLAMQAYLSFLTPEYQNITKFRKFNFTVPILYLKKTPCKCIIIHKVHNVYISNIA